MLRESDKMGIQIERKVPLTWLLSMVASLAAGLFAIYLQIYDTARGVDLLVKQMAAVTEDARQTRLRLDGVSQSDGLQEYRLKELDKRVTVLEMPKVRR
jgi:hypothetical protein